MKNLEQLLKKTTQTKDDSIKATNSLAEQLNQFDKADKIINQLNQSEGLQKQNIKKDKMEYVTYAIPESFTSIINDIIKKCMRQELSINKSEIIRLGIQMVNELSLDELINRLNEVKVERGRPKL